MKLVLLCLLVASATARENLNTLLLQLKRALGEELQPANTESCGFRGDVIFLLDASSSINEDDYAISKTFVKDLIGSFNVAPDQVRVGVVAFNQFVHVAYNLDKITEEGQTAETIQNLVDTVAPIKSGTFTDKGLSTIREEMFLPEKGDRPDAPNIVITITDGRSRNQTKTIKEAQLLRETGVVMIAVGIGKWRSDEELQVLSSNDKFMISVDNFDGLDTIKTVLAKRTCKALEDPPQFITECSARADVLFVIDGSSSVKDEDFTIAKRFITTILDSFIVSSKYLQVAAMSFDQKVRHGFYFNTYKTIGDMKEGIMEMQQYQVGTFTHLALEAARNDYFNPIHGARDDVPSIIILLTDGRSRKPELTMEQANITKGFDIKIMTIGIGKKKIDELEAMASLGNDTQVPLSFSVEDYDHLTNVMQGLVEQTCKERPVIVKECTIKMDTMFVIDLSGSVGDEKPKIQDFVSKVANGYNFSEEAGRFGFITFNKKPYLDLKLSEGTSLEAVKAKVDEMRDPDTGTMTWKALDMLRLEAFTPENGGRPDAKKVAMIISDGKSRDMSLTIESARLMKEANITPFVITVGKFKEDEINAMAGVPAFYYRFSVDNFDQLFSHIKVLKKRSCEEATKPDVAPEKRQLLKDLEALIELEQKLENKIV